MAATLTVGTGKDYSTVQAAIDAIPGNLSGQGIQSVEVYAGGAANVYDEAINAYSGFSNDSPSDYIHIVSMLPHEGKTQAQGGSGIKLAVRGTGVGLFQTRYGKCTGFEITESPTVGLVNYGVHYGSYYECIIHDMSGTTWFYACAVSVELWNCMVYNMSGNTAFDGQVFGIGVIWNYTVNIYNATVYNINNAGAGRGEGLYRSTGTVNLKNVVSMGSERDFAGTFSSVEYCCSSDDTADDWGGAGNLINKVAANQFADLTGGSEDLHLKSGSDCIGAGTDLSGTFTDDIDGETRSAWDIGADEYIAPTGIRRKGICKGVNRGIMRGVA